MADLMSDSGVLGDPMLDIAELRRIIAEQQREILRLAGDEGLAKLEQMPEGQPREILELQQVATVQRAQLDALRRTTEDP